MKNTIYRKSQKNRVKNMNRLMRAEWYRVRHSNNIIKWLMLICVVLAVIPVTDLKLKTTSEYMVAATKDTVIFVQLFLIMFSAVMVGFMYMNKTAFYEVMAGNRIHHMIMSKVLVDATFITVAVSGCYIIGCVLMGFLRGWGNIDNLAVRGLLFFIILYHISACGILIMMSFRQMGGVLVAFLKVNLLESGLMVWIEMLFQNRETKTSYTKLMNWFPMNQIEEAIGGRIRMFLVAEIVVSLLVECVFWYLIAYYGMKKRKY